ncbi:Leucine rich repeat [Chlorella sorokiniana]|uniref:Leucine rich repeat n=1 Tax=Chlorella sorokiniana TaxID=3076 RepID=A0A2P6U108_CHLSO|nr:Leucine rich repeat [Chlorella sorokiniana]|eukprot:PRW59999.1 Leucine rich repeat [Chlorella sorokiniana]
MGEAEPSSAAARVLADAYLLQRVLSYVPMEDMLRHVPLVSKAFRDASQWCWAELELDALRLGPTAPAPGAAAAFWRGLAAWAGRRAAGIRSLKLLNVRHLLRDLDEGQRLAALAGLWQALASGAGGGGPALQSLELGRSSVALAPGTLAAAACLTGMRELTLYSAGPIDFAEVDAIAQSLCQLESLTLCLLRQRGVHSSFRGPFPAALTRLRRLRRLHLEAPYSGFIAPQCALPDGIGAWGGQMRELLLINLGLECLPPSIGRLTALRELCLGRNRLGARHDSLPVELAELTSLVRLELQYNGFEWGPPAVVGELTTLEELNLSGNLWGSAAPDLPKEYAQLSRLRYLTLTNCELLVLPPVVRGMAGLQLLKLNINRLQTLPSGPYLQELECLDLAHNRFAAGYPHALAGAPKLQLIAFQHRGVHYSDPAVALLDAFAPASPRLTGALAAAVLAAAAAQPGLQPLPVLELELGPLIN